MQELRVRGAVQMRRPAAALGSDGHIYVNVSELLDEVTSAELYRMVSAVAAGDLLIAVRARTEIPTAARSRIDDAVAEIIAQRR